MPQDGIDEPAAQWQTEEPKGGGLGKNSPLYESLSPALERRFAAAVAERDEAYDHAADVAAQALMDTKHNEGDYYYDGWVEAYEAAEIAAVAIRALKTKEPK